MSLSHVGQELAPYDPVELARNQEVVGNVVSPFLKTSLEIRIMIYEYLLSTKYCKVDFQDADTICLEELKYDDCKGVFQIHPAILAVNHQINHEASQTVRENSFVRVTLDFQFDTNSLPVVAKDELACRVTYAAMEVFIIDTEHSHLNANLWNLMFAGDDMATFCRILSRRYPFPGSLLIAVISAPRSTSVWKLLEPFRRIHGMASVKITGLIEDGYRSDLITNMLQQAPTGNTVLQEILDAIDEGDQAASIHDYSTALSRFKKAFVDLDDYWTIYETADVIVESGVFNGQSLIVAFAQILVTLNIKLAVTNLKLKNFRQMSGWKLGLVSFINRILRVEVVKRNRALDILAIEKLIKALSKYADFVRAHAGFLTEEEMINGALNALQCDD